MNASAKTKKTGLREHLPLTPRRETHFRWRGTEVTRVEGITDAVFAFAVTLLVVALEVPHTYEGLLDVVRGFPAFVICFALLMLFWNAHYRYHRRYGLEDGQTRRLTMGILVLLSIVLAIITSNGLLPGFIYFLLGPLQALRGWWFGRQVRALPEVSFARHSAITRRPGKEQIR